MIVKALEWTGDVNGFLELVDQRKLPSDFVKLQCRNVETLFEAIKTLAVRGAPAIGVCAAYGLVLAMQKSDDTEDLKKGLIKLNQSAEYLATSRPTAVNLFWALERVEKKAKEFAADNLNGDLQMLREAVLAVAGDICREDQEMCRQIGENGEKFIGDGAGILTHCNAGALATAGQGTALSLIFEAARKGKKFKVYVYDKKKRKTVKITFGARGYKIKKSNPKRKKRYCASSKGIGFTNDKLSPNYWSRRFGWEC